MQPQAKSLSSKQEHVDLTYEKLANISARLKAAQKVLRRDWPNLSPRQRSEMSRNVRELESEHTSLQQEIEILDSL